MPGIALKPGFSEESLKDGADDDDEVDGAAGGTCSAPEQEEEDTFDGGGSWGMPSNLPPARANSKTGNGSGRGSG